MDKLAKLVEKRSTVRTGITKLVKKSHSLDFQTETEESLTELFETLEIREYALKALNLEIEDLIQDPEKFKSEIALSEDYEEKVFAAKIKI